MENDTWRAIATWFLYFVVYAVAGYILEVSHSSNRKKSFQNRGFLFGPYCPIYGFGAVFMLLITMEVKMNPVMTFIMATVVCTVLEYATSFLMEKIFNMRWWDYSKVPYNLNGRICLRNSLFFGIGGLTIIYITQPPVAGIIDGLSTNILIVTAVAMAIVMAVDVVMSTIASFNVKGFVKELANDSTNQIKKLAKDYYEQRRQARKKVIGKIKKSSHH